MKIFIICCLLFIHVNMCIYIQWFRVSIRVSGIRGFGFGDGFPPESVFGADSGFNFGFRFWVHGDSTRSEPDPLPSLPGRRHRTSSRGIAQQKPNRRIPRARFAGGRGFQKHLLSRYSVRAEVRDGEARRLLICGSLRNCFGRSGLD